MESVSLSTLPELVAFALVTELRASQRYSEDADCMESLGNSDLAAVFRRLADEEGEHAAKLESFVAESGLDIDMETATRQFDALLHRESSKQSDGEFSSGRLTPYGVLARAVRNEERAFKFYCHVAATADNAQMRAYAEAFAHEELAHAALFRSERRKAYQMEHGERVSPFPAPHNYHDIGALLRLALDQETALLETVSGASDRLVHACTEVVSQIRVELETLGASTASGSPVGGADRADAEEKSRLSESFDASNHREELDRLFALYDHIANTSQAEDVAQRAQSLMATTLERIEYLD